MLRFILTLMLTVVLLVSCRGDRSVSQVTDWETGQLGVTLQTQSVKNTAPFIWWEAEKPAATNFPAPDLNPFAPANAIEANLLSNGQWIGVDGKRSNPLFLEYSVQVPTQGKYFFYARKFWQHGPFRWRWDDQPWQRVGNEVYLLDQIPMRENVAVNWTNPGQVTLQAGTHRLRIELTELEGAAAFDCFLLTTASFHPQGKLKPNQQYVANLPGGFLFQPAPDPYSTSPLDLRYLNEAIAGENGFIQVRGNSFVHPKTGQPERFWAVNVGGEGLEMDPVLMQSMARFLAKQGVNMVRVHTPYWSDSDLGQVSATKLDKLFAFVAAMKQEGIYTCLSIYFPVWLEMKQEYGFPGYQGQHPFALLFFNPEFQQRYYGWWRALLTTPNPYTGKALREDPAVALVELVNEDSYFFWTFQPYETIPAAQMALLEDQFAGWLKTRYGSLEKARQSWGTPNSQPVRGDSPERDRVGLLSAGDMAAQRSSRRAQDTAAFLAESQQQFFQRAIAVLRQDLGYKGLVYASNWVTADAQILGPLDKYTNTVADVMDRHGYFESPHQGPAAAYSLNVGDTYEDRSALLFTASNSKQEQDFDLPIMDIHYNGKPSIITELNWAMPNRYRADFPLLAAAYGLLQDTSGCFFFATQSPNWDSLLGKFAIASPVVMGQFPATALIYRKGLLKPGEAVVDVALKTDDIFQLKGAPVTAPQNLDEFRAKDIPAGQTLQNERAESMDPLAFYVGKVSLNFSQTSRSARQKELSQFIDRRGKTVRSSTGELLWDYGKGLVTVNGEKVQGVTGFLRQAGLISLNHLQIRSDLDYGTILLVPLDNQPLASSRRMLLQVMSEDQNFGWKTTGSPQKTIENVGTAAIAVRNLTGKLALLRSDAATLTVTALDTNGYPSSQIGRANQIQLLPNTFYYLIQP